MTPFSRASVDAGVVAGVNGARACVMFFSSGRRRASVVASSSRMRARRSNARASNGVSLVFIVLVASCALWCCSGRVVAELVALDTETFKRDVLNSREPWVVSFTAGEGCEICAYVGAKYEEAARKASSLGVKFGVFDVSAEGVELDELAQVVALRTIPMVLAYPTYKTENPYDRRRSVKSPAAYPIASADGTVNEVSARAFTTFAEKALPTHLVERIEITGDVVSEDLIMSKDASAKTPTAVLLTNKATTSSLLKAISHELEGRMRVIEVAYPSSASELPRLPGVDASQSPRLVVYSAGTLAAPAMFDSDALKADRVREFLTANAGPEVELEVEIRSAKGGAKTSDANKGAQEDAYAPQSVLAPLRGADFKATVIDDPKYHVVVFTKSSDVCDDIVKALPARFEAFRGTVALHEVIVGGGDEDANALLADASLGLFADASACVDIAAFPESDEGEARDVELFKPSTTTKASGYTAESLSTFIMSHIMDLSLEVDAKTMDRALFGREPHKPKVLLFMDEGDEASHDAIRLLSSAHKDFIFAVTTSKDEQLVAQFQIKKRPELIVISMKADDDAPVTEDGVGMRMNVHKYPAQVFMQQIASAWIEQLRAQIFGVDTASLNIPMPSTVDDQAQFDAECAAKGGLCVVAHIKDNNPAHVKIIHELAKTLHNKPFHFVIVDPSTQRSFSSVFEVNNPVDYPTVTVLASRQQRAVTHKNEFDLHSLKAFCEDVLNGKVKTWRFQDMPILVQGGERVEEVIEEIIEEEFDLSDIMGESVEGEAAMSREELAAKLAAEEAAAEAERKAAEAERKAAEDAAKPKKKKKSKKKKAKTEL